VADPFNSRNASNMCGIHCTNSACLLSVVSWLMMLLNSAVESRLCTLIPPLGAANTSLKFGTQAGESFSAGEQQAPLHALSLPGVFQLLPPKRFQHLVQRQDWR
jgi:hypothetical protein